MNRTVTLSILILVVVLCALMGCLLAAGGAFLYFQTSPTISQPALEAPSQEPAPETTPNPATPQPATTPSSVLDPTQTLDLAATPNATTLDGLPIPPEIASQMDKIQQQVLELRGLPQKSPLQRGMLTTDQLHEKVLNDFFKDYTREEAATDALVLSLFGLLEPGTDLYQLYIDLYSEQVAGYYDSQTKEMYVVQGKGFHGTERMTYSHEFTHVLQDQTYDLEQGMKLNDEYCQNQAEYCAAVTALIEGDATLAEQTWFFHYSTKEDKEQIGAFYETYQSPVFDALPPFMKDDFLFPYTQGFEFVQTIFDEGGWAAVDAAYRSPPLSTEQILHPDDYPNDVPQEVELPNLLPALGQGWEEIDRDNLGEWYTFLMLARGRQAALQLPEAQARQAAAGWEGDRYVIYTRAESEAVLVLRSRWETDKDAGEFFKALRDYAARRWGRADKTKEERLDWHNGTDGAVTIARRGQDTLLVIAPDSTTVEEILKAID